LFHAAAIVVMSDASWRSIVPINLDRFVRYIRARSRTASGEEHRKGDHRHDFCGLLEPPLSKVPPLHETDEPELAHAVTLHPFAILPWLSWASHATPTQADSGGFSFTTEHPTTPKL
jgi:hypothetical protein